MGRLAFVVFASIIIPLLAIASIFVDLVPDSPRERQTKPIQTEKKDKPVPNGDRIRVPVPTSPQSGLFTPPPAPILKPIDMWKRLVDNYYAEPARLPTSTFLATSSPLFLRGVQAPEYFPIRNWEVAEIDIDAMGAIALEMPQEKGIYQKNAESIRSIASLTKLATALVAIEALSLDEEVFITPEAVLTPGEAGGLFVNELLTVEQLLYALLLDSSNDAAIALQEAYHLRRTEVGQTMVLAMNKKATELGLDNTLFVEPTGLLSQNTSSPRDIALLLYAAYENETLRKIMGTSIYETTSVDGLPHRWVNRNTLLKVIFGVVGGKTGYTEEAGESMAVVTKIADNRVLITVVLGSQDRVAAMTNLITWAKDAYIWE